MNPATESELDSLVSLEGRLFAEDAAVHDTYVDLTWSERKGRDDLAHLMDEDSGLVLAARDEDSVIGLLVAYTAESSPTRQPVTYAMLRTMYVVPEYRDQGVGRLMAEQFLTWADGKNCVEAHVSSYAANEGAHNFYEGLGFKPLSLSRVRAL